VILSFKCGTSLIGQANAEINSLKIKIFITIEIKVFLFSGLAFYFNGFLI
jgi:hypothetical protein